MMLLVHNLAESLMKRSTLATSCMHSALMTSCTRRKIVPSARGQATRTFPHASERKIRETLEVAVPALLRKRPLLMPALSSSYAVTRTTIDHLAGLNGFHHRLQIEHHHVQLAEGVMAIPSKTIDQDYVIYAKPTSSPPIRVDTEKRKKFKRTLKKEETKPSFREEDFSLYRIIQGRVEDDLNRREELIRDQINAKMNQIQQFYQRIVSTADEFIDKVAGSRKPKQKVSDLTSEGTDVDARTVPTGNQDLLIASRDGRVLMVEDVPFEYSLLVLPTDAFRLRHGRAASIIYLSLVLFGAAPLTYRSLKFALDYPALAQIMVASVLGSVSYSLWASREGARTRQSLVVMSAAASRIIARDASALLILREKGTQALVEAVGDEYLSRGKGKEIAREDQSQAMESLPMRPVDIAVELGLLVQENGGVVVGRNWEEASVEVARRISTSA